MAEHHHSKRRKERTTTIAAVDWISNLPYPILHQILSLLPHTDVIRTCVLSKTFSSVFTSFPVIDLEFLQYSRSTPVSSLPEKMAEFVDYVNYSVQRLNLDTDLQKFRLRANIEERKQAHRILKHINFAIRNRVEELDIDLVRPRYSLPQTITSAKFIKTLNLAGLRLINLSALDLNSWWPMLESLSISRSTGLKNFDFSSKKIRSICLESCVGLNTMKIESSSLEIFTYLGTSKPCEIDVSECKFIKVLSLGYASVRDNWVEDNVPKFLHLEDLKLIKLSPKSHKVKVSSENLKKLELVKRHGRIEIQASNLESLRYSGFGNNSVNIQDCFPLKSLSWESNKIPGRFLKKQISNFGGLESLGLEFNRWCVLTRFEINHQNGSQLLPPVDEMVRVKLQFPILVSFKTFHSYLPRDFMCSDDLLDVMLSNDSESPMDNKDFVALWNWIASFGRVKVFTFVCSSFQDLVYSENERLELLTPMYDLKHLTIKQSIWRSISPELVNSFLWQSPNLETLQFTSTGDINRSMEFVYGSRTGRTDSPPCCRRLSINCWRHSMRKVVLKNFDDVEREEFLKYFMENAMMLDKIRY